MVSGLCWIYYAAYFKAVEIIVDVLYKVGIVVKKVKFCKSSFYHILIGVITKPPLDLDTHL